MGYFCTGMHAIFSFWLESRFRLLTSVSEVRSACGETPWRSQVPRTQDNRPEPSRDGPAESDVPAAVRVSSPVKGLQSIPCARARALPQPSLPHHLHNFILALQNLGPPRQFDHEGVVRTRDRFQVDPRETCVAQDLHFQYNYLNQNLAWTPKLQVSIPSRDFRVPPRC
jgi:hypothetical protein